MSRYSDGQHTRSTEMAGRILDGQVIKLVIYEENLDDPCCFAHIMYRSGRFEKVPPSAGQPRISWALSRRSLKDIIDNRREIIERPHKPDWGCLVSRLGISSDDPPPSTCEYRNPDQSCDLREENERLLDYLRQLQDSNSDLVTSTRATCLTNFAAGLAHEVNNPLSVVQSAADAAERGVRHIDSLLDDRQPLERESIRRYTRLIKDNLRLTVAASQRIAKVVKSLRKFSNIDRSEFQLTDIHESLDNTLEILGHCLTDRIEVVKKYGDIPAITCHPVQLNQAFLNILQNAAQAIENEGRIEIVTRADDDFVYIEITDTGKGIPSERLQKIFEFNFHKNGPRVRVGTGLPTSLNIIKKHGGDLQLASETDGGTTVIIKLPRTVTACACR